jgi:hypothetical protein
VIVAAIAFVDVDAAGLDPGQFFEVGDDRPQGVAVERVAVQCLGVQGRSTESLIHNAGRCALNLASHRHAAGPRFLRSGGHDTNVAVLLPWHRNDEEPLSDAGLRAKNAVQTGMVRVRRQAVSHSYANAARAWCRRPFRHYIVNRWIGRVDRRHNPKLIRIGVVNFERVARIVFIGAERRDHDRTVDADTVLRSSRTNTPPAPNSKIG